MIYCNLDCERDQDHELHNIAKSPSSKSGSTIYLEWSLTLTFPLVSKAIKVYVEQDTADDPEDSDQPGAVVLVTHDIRLLEELDCQLLVCKDYKVELFEGSIQDYKEEVLAELQMQEMDAEYS